MSNSFSLPTGRASKILLIDPDAVAISLSKVMDWTFKEDIKKVESTGLDGVREILPAFNGASGSFTVELQDAGLYDFFAARKAEYQANGAYRYSSFFAYIDYPDGAEQAIQFTNVTLYLDTGGDFKNEETIKLKISFESQDYTEL